MSTPVAATVGYGRADGPHSVRLHRYACAVAGATWLLIIAGGMVTSKQAGLSVPDWPTSWGYNMFTFPPSQWVGGIFYEHGHRLIASGVGMLTIGLCVWLWMRERRRWLCWLGSAALAAVVLQGILGGLTVRYLLPTWISVSHACLAQTFFCIVISIAAFTSPAWTGCRCLPHGADPASSEGPRIQTPHLALALMTAVFGQLLLGALMRHTESGYAVTDFPLAYGQVIPSLSNEAVERYNDFRRFELAIPAVTARQIGIHMAHRAGAVGVTVLSLWVGAVILARHGSVAALRRTVILILLLIAVQLALGAWTIWTEKAAAVATAHVAIGAAILGASWLLVLRAYQHVGCVRRSAGLPDGALSGAAA